MSTIEAMEAHEAAEWFRVSGRMVADPHRDGATALRGVLAPEEVEHALTLPHDTARSFMADYIVGDRP